ncbi:Receptor family ligand binding region [compost metagenome]
MDERMLAATGDLAKGTNIVSLWNPQSDNPANQQFVKAFTEKYNRKPTVYAAQSYDTARLIGAALKTTGGNLKDIQAYRAAMQNVKFDSIRGNFRFAQNRHPVIDWYLLQVQAGADGKLTEVPIKTLATDHVDSFAAQCTL